jgi:two-component system chemotaxis response regulator CheY
MILTFQGFEVLEAKNGAEGLERLHTCPAVDLVLLDWNMPCMNGLELLKAMRAESELKKTCVVMVTTETETTEIATALEAGANEYIMKPFTPDVIADKLQLLGFPVAFA